MNERILVIQSGSLGDLVLCMDAFAALRAAYPDATLAVLVEPSLAAFAREMPWFDDVLTDAHPQVWNPVGWVHLLCNVRAYAPTRVFDFVGTARQSVLFWALGGRLCGPVWSGAAQGGLPADGQHYTDFLSTQLERADVRVGEPANLGWLDDALEGFELPQRYALFLPFAAWSAENYAALAERFAAKGIGVLAASEKAGEVSLQKLRGLAPIVDVLPAQPTLRQMAALARRSVCVVGNDNGPSYLAAAVGAKTIALMPSKTDPHWSAPEGARVRWLHGEPQVDDVWQVAGF